MNWGGREEVWGLLDLCVGSGRRTPPGRFSAPAATARRSAVNQEKSPLHSLIPPLPSPSRRSEPALPEPCEISLPWTSFTAPFISLRGERGSLEAASRLLWLFYLSSVASFSPQCSDCSRSDESAETRHSAACVKGEQIPSSEGLGHQGMLVPPSHLPSAHSKTVFSFVITCSGFLQNLSLLRQSLTRSEMPLANFQECDLNPVGILMSPKSRLGYCTSAEQGLSTCFQSEERGSLNFKGGGKPPWFISQPGLLRGLHALSCWATTHNDARTVTSVFLQEFSCEFVPFTSVPAVPKETAISL